MNRSLFNNFLKVYSTFLLIALISCSSKETDSPMMAAYDVKYGDGQYNKMDVYYEIPAGKKKLPVIIFVHGGGWNSQDKNIWDRYKASYFLRNGFISVSVNYILSANPVSLKDNNRIIHPAHVNDIAKAVSWIHDNIGQYYGDSSRIFLIGWSAGSQLVDLLGTNEIYLENYKESLGILKGVCSIDAGAYLTYDKQLLFPKKNDPNVKNEFKELVDFYYNAFGFDESNHISATPYFHVSANKGIPPFLLIYEGNVPYRSKPNLDFFEKLKTNGCLVDKFDCYPCDHYVYSIIGTKKDSIGVSNVILNFFQKRLNISYGTR